MSYYTRNTSPQVGSVAYLHNPNLERFKRNKATTNRGYHPHVITEIRNGIATCVALSTSGDIFAEKNTIHFIPPQSCAKLNTPSWPIPHRGTFTIPVDQFPRNHAPLCDTALDIVFGYIDTYEHFLNTNPEAFDHFGNATYPKVNTVRFDAYASDVYNELGLPVLNYAQAVAKATAAKQAR